MSLLTILEFPDPRLRKKAAPVESVDDALRNTLDDMVETMRMAPGVGLAAPQVDVSQRVIVVEFGDEYRAYQQQIPMLIPRVVAGSRPPE